MPRRQVNTVLNINSLYSYHKLLGLFFSRMWIKSYQPWHFRFYKYIYGKMSWEKNHEWYLFKDSADTLSMQSFLWISKRFREMIWTWGKNVVERFHRNVKIGYDWPCHLWGIQTKGPLWQEACLCIGSSLEFLSWRRRVIWATRTGHNGRVCAYRWSRPVM